MPAKITPIRPLADALHSNDPLAQPPATPEQVQDRVGHVQAVLNDLLWTLATDAEGKVDPAKEQKAYDSIHLAIRVLGKLLQPVREVFHPTLDREATVLDALDRLSPHTRYGYVSYSAIHTASPDARFSAIYKTADDQGRPRYRYPLHDVLDALVERGAVEQSKAGDYRRPGAKGLPSRS
jgi:hypothetical protein